jgi:hypothetical protein
MSRKETTRYYVNELSLFVTLFYGSIAKRLNLPVLHVYVSATFLILIPLLFFSILTLAEEIAPSSSSESFYVRILMCFLVFAGFFSFSPRGLFYRFALWDSFFVSQAYLISLILFMGFLSSVISENYKKSAAEWTLWLILLFSAKVSVGILSFVILTVHTLLMKDRSWLSKARLITIWITLSSLLGYFLTVRFTTDFKPDFIEKYAYHLLHGTLRKVLTLIAFVGMHFFMYGWLYCLY